MYQYVNFWYTVCIPSLKLTFSHLKSDGWNAFVSFWVSALRRWNISARHKEMLRFTQCTPTDPFWLWPYVSLGTKVERAVLGGGQFIEVMAFVSGPSCAVFGIFAAWGTCLYFVLFLLVLFFLFFCMMCLYSCATLSILHLWRKWICIPCRTQHYRVHEGNPISPRTDPPTEQSPWLLVMRLDRSNLKQSKTLEDILYSR